MPAGTLHGMPVGAMLVGPRYGEPAVLKVARAFEMTHGWGPLPPQ